MMMMTSKGSSRTSSDAAVDGSVVVDENTTTSTATTSPISCPPPSTSRASPSKIPSLKLQKRRLELHHHHQQHHHHHHHHHHQLLQQRHLSLTRPPPPSPTSRAAVEEDPGRAGTAVAEHYPSSCWNVDVEVDIDVGSVDNDIIDETMKMEEDMMKMKINLEGWRDQCRYHSGGLSKGGHSGSGDEGGGGVACNNDHDQEGGDDDEGNSSIGRNAIWAKLLGLHVTLLEDCQRQQQQQQHIDGNDPPRMHHATPEDVAYVKQLVANHCCWSPSTVVEGTMKAAAEATAPIKKRKKNVKEDKEHDLRHSVEAIDDGNNNAATAGGVGETAAASALAGVVEATDHTSSTGGSSDRDYDHDDDDDVDDGHGDHDDFQKHNLLTSPMPVSPPLEEQLGLRNIVAESSFKPRQQRVDDTSGLFRKLQLDTPQELQKLQKHQQRHRHRPGLAVEEEEDIDDDLDSARGFANLPTPPQPPHLTFGTPSKKDQIILRKLLLHFMRRNPHLAVQSKEAVFDAPFVNALTVLFMALNQNASATYLVGQRLLMEYPLGAVRAMTTTPPPQSTTPPTTTTTTIQQRLQYLWRQTLHPQNDHEHDPLHELVFGDHHSNSNTTTNIIATSWIPAWLAQDLPDLDLLWRLWDVLIVSPPDGIYYFCIALVHFFRGSLLSGECPLEQLPAILLVDNANSVNENKYAVLEQVVARCLLFMEYSDTGEYYCDDLDAGNNLVVDNKEADDGEQPQEQFMDAVPTQAQMPSASPPAWFTTATAPTDIAVLQRLEVLRRRKRQRLPLLVENAYKSASRYGSAATSSHNQDGLNRGPPATVSRNLRFEFDLQATTSLLGRGTESTVSSGNGARRMGTREKILLFLFLMLAAMAAVWDFTYNTNFEPPFISRQDTGDTSIQPAISVDEKSMALPIIVHPSQVVPAEKLIQDGSFYDQCDGILMRDVSIPNTSSNDESVERVTPVRAAENSTINKYVSPCWKCHISAASTSMDRLRGSLTSLGRAQMERVEGSLSILRSICKRRTEGALAVAFKLKSVGQQESQQLQNAVKSIDRFVTYRTLQSQGALNASARQVMRVPAFLEHFGQEKLLHGKKIFSSAGFFASSRFIQLKENFTSIASTTHGGVLDAKSTVATIGLQGRRQVGLTASQFRKNANPFFYRFRAVIADAADSIKVTLGSAVGRFKTRSQMIQKGAVKALDQFKSTLTAGQDRLVSKGSTTVRFLMASVVSFGTNVKAGVSISVRHVPPKARLLRQCTIEAACRLGSAVSTQWLRASEDLNDTVQTLRSSLSLGRTKVSSGTAKVGRSVVQATRQKGKLVAMKEDVIWKDFRRGASWIKEFSSFQCRRIRNLGEKQAFRFRHSTRRLFRAVGTIPNEIVNRTDVVLPQLRKASGKALFLTRRLGRKATASTKAGLNVTVASWKNLQSRGKEAGSRVTSLSVIKARELRHSAASQASNGKGEVLSVGQKSRNAIGNASVAIFESSRSTGVLLLRGLGVARQSVRKAVKAAGSGMVHRTDSLKELAKHSGDRLKTSVFDQGTHLGAAVNTTRIQVAANARHIGNSISSQVQSTARTIKRSIDTFNVAFNATQDEIANRVAVSQSLLIGQILVASTVLATVSAPASGQVFLQGAANSGCSGFDKSLEVTRSHVVDGILDANSLMTNVSMQSANSVFLHGGLTSNDSFQSTSAVVVQLFDVTTEQLKEPAERLQLISQTKLNHMDASRESLRTAARMVSSHAGRLAKAVAQNLNNAKAALAHMPRHGVQQLRQNAWKDYSVIRDGTMMP